MKQLSAAQIAMLRSARDHGGAIHHLHGRSAIGGAHRTYHSLRRAGFMDPDWHITVTGRDTLEHIEDEESGHDPRTPEFGVGYTPS